MLIGRLNLTVNPQTVGEQGEGRVAIPAMVGGELPLDRVGSSRNREGLHCDKSLTGGETGEKSLDNRPEISH